MTVHETELAAENARLRAALAEAETRVAGCEGERDQALAQQAAMAAVLRTIAATPADLSQTLGEIVAGAARFTGLEILSFYRLDGNEFRNLATAAPATLAIPLSFACNPASVSGRAVAQRQTVTVDDLLTADDYPTGQELARRYGHHSALSVPLLREGEAIGVLAAARLEVRPFTAQEVQLLETYAAQAVIAIENARLFDELQQRTRELELRNTDLAESLGQQTATSEILRIISASPTDVHTALEAISERAGRLSAASVHAIWLRDGEEMVLAAGSYKGAPLGTRGSLSGAAASGMVVARAILERRTIVIADLLGPEGEAFPTARRALGSNGWRALLTVPLLQHGDAIGAFVINREQPGQFSERLVALIQAFADQAVIAIQNARLFVELQERNTDLRDSLERQTATSEVLEIISRRGDSLQQVLDAIVARSAALTGSETAALGFIVDGANHLVSSLFMGRMDPRSRLTSPVILRDAYAPDTVTREIIEQQRPLMQAGGEDAILERFTGERAFWKQLHAAGHPLYGALLSVPLILGDQAYGTLTVLRTSPEPYTDAQVALLEVFARQAVVAIENTRLLEEIQQQSSDLEAGNASLRESLDQQTATAEILRAISDNPGDEHAALQAVADAACRLCHADDGTVWLRHGDGIVAGPIASGREMLEGYLPEGESLPPDAARQFLTVIDQRRTVHISDVVANWQSRGRQERAERSRRRGDVAWLLVPLLNGAEGLGVLHLTGRNAQRPFSDAEIALAERFANQAAIAIQNARMFVQLQERNREVSAALEQQTAVAEVLRIVSSSPTDLQGVLDAVLPTAVRLSGADAGALIRVEGTRAWNAINYNLALGVAAFDAEHRAERELDPETVPSDYAAVHREVVQFAGTPDEVRRRWPRAGFDREDDRAQTRVYVPLLRDDAALGVLIMIRQSLVPFTERQIALLRVFADQAVIAIENARLFDEIQQSNAGLREALEQQTAVAGVLQAISRSAFDLQAVLETLNENAARLLHVERCVIYRRHGDELRQMAVRGATTDVEIEVNADRVVRLDEPDNVALAVLQKRPRRATIFADNPLLQQAPSQVQRFFAATGTWSFLTAPLLNGDDAIGAIQVSEPGERRFTDAEVRLLQTFADQAVIAMENARLVQDLRDSLERQTATSEVLEIISHRDNDLQEVLDAIVTRSAALTGSETAVMNFIVDDAVHMVSMLYNGRIDPRLRLSNPGIRTDSLAPGTPGREVIEHKRPLVLSGGEDATIARYPGQAAFLASRRATGFPEYGSELLMPLILNDAVFGILVVLRTSPEPYTDAQVALLEVFARQAMVAIENTRLIEEIQQKSRELEAGNASLRESLDQQTAVAEVLRIVSSSPTDLQGVLDAVVRTATQLCQADTGGLARVEGTRLGPSTFYDMVRGRLGTEVGQEAAHELDPGILADYAVLHRQDVQISGTPAEIRQRFPRAMFLGREKPETRLAIPLLRDDAALGVLIMARHSQAPFTERQIALLRIFADQAVIAIENARLFDDIQESNAGLRESLDQQTATAEILRAISDNPGDQQAALQAVTDAACRLCHADDGVVWLRHDDGIVAGPNASGREMLEGYVSRGESPPLGAVAFFLARIAARRTVHIPDMVTRLQSLGEREQADISRRRGDTAQLLVPLLHGGEGLGLLQLGRRTGKGPFSDAEIALAETFASQAVIAIQNSHLFVQLQAKTGDLERSVERQRSLAAVGQVVSSTLEIDQVLAAIIERASALADVDGASVYRYDEPSAELRLLGQSGGGVEADAQTAAIDRVRARVVRMGEGWIGGIAAGRELSIVEDIETNPVSEALRTFAEQTGLRAYLGVPLLAAGRLLGVLVFARRAPGPFTTEITELLQTFANQCAIALRNAQLFEAVQQSNHDLGETLEQQSAVAEVLRIVSSSPTDLQAVLDAVLRTAMRLCRAESGRMTRVEGTRTWGAVLYDPVRGNFGFNAERAGEHELDPAAYQTDYVAVHREVLQDAGTPAEIRQRFPRTSFAPGSTSPETRVYVPLLRNDTALGVLVMVRNTLVPFSERDITLLRIFADQAVIAIENARLFDEIQQKSRELEAGNASLRESLEQQTAVAEVLRIVSSSPTDLQAVLNAVVSTATQLCQSEAGALARIEGTQIWRSANYDPFDRGEIWSDAERGGEHELDPEFVADYAALQREVVQVAGTPAEIRQRFPQAVFPSEAVHTRIAVPLLRDGTALGVLVMIRPTLVPFSERQVALLQTFANQAVIAIENSRLFEEIQQSNASLREALEQQTATAEVLQAISRSAFDLESVFQTLLDSAQRLCNADGGAGLWRLQDGRYRVVGLSSSIQGRRRELALQLAGPADGPGPVALAARTRQVQIYAQRPDEPPDDASPALTELWELTGTAAMLTVPVVSGDDVPGVIQLSRREGGAYTDRQVQLLQIFAAQAAIAIENTRLIEEIQQKSSELEVVNQELEEASQHKSVFLANMSHELRTPLNAIIGYSEMLQEEAEDAGAADLLPDLGKINAAGKHLLSLINDILDLTKIEAGKMDLFVEPFDVAAAVRDVGAIVQGLMEKNGNTLQIDCPPDSGEMRADQTKLRQTLFNLLSNAAKFTEGGRITLDVRREPGPGPAAISSEPGNYPRSVGTLSMEGDRLLFTVSDTGIGMTEEEQERLFQAFSQADASTTRRFGGTGLGLAISRHFCRMMGGDISVHSTPGQGSTFTVELPAVVDGAAPVPTPVPDGAGTAAAATARETGKVETAVPGTGGAAARGTVLAIDDDEQVLDLLRRSLRGEGYTVLTAASGEDGLRLAREARPDAITLDVLMPGMDGWQVLAALKADPELAQIPVIVLTMLDDRDLGFTLGATAFLTKPVDRERLLTLLREHTSLHAAGDASSSPPAVLVVDDDALTREMLRRMLEGEGWSVGEASNGVEALAALERARPALILLDLMMPQMDGFAVVEALRARPEWREIPVVVVTAKDLTDEERRRLNGGVERTLQKGAYRRADLLGEVRSLLAAHTAPGRGQPVAQEGNS